jgi:hypothetical protein
MSVLANLATDDSIENEKDVVFTGGPLDSGIYMCQVLLAFIGKAASGAMSLVLHLKTEEGREVRQTLWITSGDAKGNRNYYEKDGQKHYLPGFQLARSLSLLTVGKELSEMETEPKMVKLWDTSAQAEIPKQVDALTALIGQDVVVGLVKQTVDKNVKNGEGKYVPSGETRDENEVDKFFRARDNKTTAEILAEKEEAEFIDVWRDKWEGQVRNRAKGASAAGAQGTAGMPGGAAAPAGTGQPAKSLFA